MKTKCQTHRRGLSALAGVLSLLACGALGVEGPVTAVQKALIYRQFLSGDPSGVLDEATHGALRQFQSQRSLPVTGEIDSATLEALQDHGKSLPPAAGAGVSASVIASDREFLREVNARSGELGPIVASDQDQAAAEKSIAVAPPKIAEPPKAEPRRAVSATKPKSKPHTIETAPDNPPIRRDTARVTSPEPAPVERATDEPVGTQGSRSTDAPVRPGAKVTITTTRSADGRILSQKRVTTYGDEPVNPGPDTASKRKDGGFFHRIFGDDDD